jgi:peptidoglycan/xylan/chitin deacetylase (PgdA/CDA1 family)
MINNSNSLISRTIRIMGDKIAAHHKGEGRLCIVNYHRVLESANPLLETEPNIKTFRWQMELLADCFNVMPLHDAVLALESRQLPPRAVCLTFDDGYRSVHDYALPILNELALPATVFVASGYVGEGSMWNDRVIEVIQAMPGVDLDLRDVGLGVHRLSTLHERKLAVEKITHASKYLPPADRLRLTQKLEELAGDGLAHGLMLTSQMLVNLAGQGIEIGAHTISHPILTKVDDEIARYEIEVGKQQLETITGNPVRLFAYPNGKIGMDFDERHVQMAKDAGFIAAFTTATGAATGKHDRFQLPRSRPWDSTPLLFGLRLLRWLAG